MEFLHYSHRYESFRPPYYSSVACHLPPLSGNWQEVLREHISPDQLPQAYGGTRCEPDPYCSDYVRHFLFITHPTLFYKHLSLSSQINPGCDVPEKYYLTNQTETSREEMERVVVGRGSSHEVEYQVDCAGTVLRCERGREGRRMTSLGVLLYSLSLHRWEFVSDSYDIGFGWYLKADDIISEVVS